MQHGPRFRDTFSLSGWLMADLMAALFLALFIFTLAVAAKPTKKHPRGPTATPTPTATATPRPTPTPTPRTCQATVILKEYSFTASGGPGGTAPTDDQIRKTFNPFRRFRAGLVLTFGHPPASAAQLSTDEQAGQGETLAGHVNNRLLHLLPGIIVRRQTILEAYHNLSNIYGAVDFKVYFFASSCR